MEKKEENIERFLESTAVPVKLSRIIKIPCQVCFLHCALLHCIRTVQLSRQYLLFLFNNAFLQCLLEQMF